ncbi:MAG: Fis family transcriptional regulator [Azoarcus sp.]|jgi:Fis family transcriptional regulator|nr:Fis family transcriptional regulator [Azoarcus sp.]
MNPCTTHNGIADAVVRSLEQYFNDLNGEKPVPVHDMVMKCVEKTLLQFVLERVSGNQSTAASLLGINRNTLRRKLTDYDLL